MRWKTKGDDRLQRGVLTFVLGLIAFSLMRPPVARAEVVDRVVAVVNDDAILLSELRLRSAPALQDAMSSDSQAGRIAAIEELYRVTLDRMVSEQLISQAADALQLRVSRAEVERAITDTQIRSGLSPTTFWHAVSQQGFSPALYRAEVERQLLRLRLLNQRARDQVNITVDEVRARYDELASSQSPPFEEVSALIYQRLLEEAMQRENRRLVSELRRRSIIDLRL